MEVDVETPDESRASLEGRGLLSRLQERKAGLVTRVEPFVSLAADRYDRAAVWVETARDRLRLPASQDVTPDGGDRRLEDRKFLWRTALVGFVALSVVAAGCSLPSSPFKLEMPGTWFFGVPPNTAISQAPSQLMVLFGLVAVYGGLVLLMRVWYGLVKYLAQRPGIPVKYLSWMFVLWVIPMLVVPPIFSRDVFSYAAQGEMVSRHINPYTYGPFTLGSGPYVSPVDKLWGNTPAPYGPLFLIIDGFFATASLHNMLVTVVLLRLLELGGVVLIAWCIPKLARAYGHDGAATFSLAVLNPLVLLTLIGGAHNDAIMAGLLVAGITAAKLRRPVLGIIICSMAAAIKVPAALGIVYIGWSWLGSGIPIRRRVRPVITAGLISGAVMLAFTVLSGLGLGWIGNLATPGTVRSWLAPPTGIGMALTGVAHAIGIGISQGAVLSFTRVVGLMAAAGISVYLLKESDRIGSLKALGSSLLIFVVLAPVVQPWYLTWGLILLAPVATRRIRNLIVVLSMMSPFIGLPGGRILLDELIHANPLAVAASLVVLLGVFLAPLGRWSRSWKVAELGESMNYASALSVGSEVEPSA